MTIFERCVLWLLYVNWQFSLFRYESAWSYWWWLALWGSVVGGVVFVYRLIIPLDRPKELTVQDGILGWYFKRRRLSRQRRRLS